jgi:phosphoribosylformylglycinamidine cyclo-ligase
MNKNSKSDSYAAAGVDITAGYKAVELMKQHVARTATSGVVDDLGGFGGLFALDMNGIQNPVLVSGTDGVGTKLKLAFLLDKHDTVGMTVLPLCVNDIICCGAKPCSSWTISPAARMSPKRLPTSPRYRRGLRLVRLCTDRRRDCGMPGFYPEDEYDLAGFSVGVVDRAKVLDKTTIGEGDVIIALPSSGVTPMLFFGCVSS